MLHIVPIPAFEDNYIWLLHNKCNAVVVDPGDAAPVLATLQMLNLSLTDILVTHHHLDHIGGVTELMQQTGAKVYAPSYEQFDFTHTALKEADELQLTSIAQNFRVMWLPGHTLGHIAYVNDDYLFCGDTLFGAGCGRLFEGTPAQMLNSLNRLKQLNTNTQVFCTHEYTAKNIAFALTLEPNNPDLLVRKQRVDALISCQLPSLPSTIGLELATNPFLRCEINNAKDLYLPQFAHKNSDELTLFSFIRTLRNHY
jgi:hydroxyacylglutathione hydrolase